MISPADLTLKLSTAFAESSLNEPAGNVTVVLFCGSVEELGWAGATDVITSTFVSFLTSIVCTSALPPVDNSSLVISPLIVVSLPLITFTTTDFFETTVFSSLLYSNVIVWEPGAHSSLRYGSG